ncbi:SIMPL domain-containing protein [Pedosphaera parvula]|uniref:DUF541 domain-containing protein n=1 Tax=Pedosphaera parvula (strain Ellin514) TaxID=320771 RepID=B9XMZ0_PEDPL|nr:SIMPL domain-containing protein [Pedosphaera parvula]EEF58786.1 protein of unknown function DUF541 [Pedosphaera parvula Ellin514]
MRKFILLAACSLIVSQLRADPELKGTPNELTQFLTRVPKAAQVTGEGELKVQADRAIITLKITTESKSLQGALRLNQEMRSKLINYLKGQDVPVDRVQASRFSSTPKYGMFSDNAKSYRVENFIKITAQGEKEFQAASGAVDSWPEVQYQGIEVEQDNKEELKRQVIAKACDNANERRKIYEEKFGVRLVPKWFSPGLTGLKSPQQASDKQYDRSYSSSPTGASLPVGGLVEVQETGSSFGELTFTAQVTVEYSVEAK